MLAGDVALPVNGVPEPFVDAEDIADVATAALTEDGHAGQLYELTGPRLLRFDEAIAEIAAASGRPVRFVPVSVEVRVGVGGAGCPQRDRVADDLPVHGSPRRSQRHLTDGVRRALGRDPRDFRDYAERTAAAGVWAG